MRTRFGGLKRKYDALRKKYFLHPPDPLNTPPRSEELRWLWLPKESYALAITFFDEDGEPESLALNPYILESTRVSHNILLHELTHMRNPKLSCHRNSAKWQEETRRLANLGAIRL